MDRLDKMIAKLDELPVQPLVPLGRFTQAFFEVHRQRVLEGIADDSVTAVPVDQDDEVGVQQHLGGHELSFSDESK